MTKLGLFCERLLEAGWLVAIATVPLYFDIYSSRVFEPDKITMLRCIVVVMALAQLVKWLERSPQRMDSSTNGHQPTADRAPRLWWPWWPGNPLAFPALLVVATYLLATLASITVPVSLWGSYQRLQGTYSMLAYIALFFLTALNLRRRAQIERLFTVMLLVSFPISFYGVVQHLRQDPLPWGGDVVARVTSSMGNAIFLAAYLIMVVPITLQRLIGAVARLPHLGPAPGSIFRGWTRITLLAGLLVLTLAILAFFTVFSARPISLWWAALPMVGMFTALSLLFYVPRPTYFTVLAEAIAYIFLLALQLLTILLTQSRGPWIGIMAGLACFAVVLAVRRGARRLLIASSAIGLALAVAIVVLNLPSSPLAPLRSVPYVGRLGDLLDAQSGTGRVRTLIWQGSWELMTTRPPIGLADSDPLAPVRLLVGYGPESMYVAFNKVYPPELAHIEARNASPDRNHNDTLDHLLETGLLGLLAYLLLLASAGYLIWKHLRRTDDLLAQLPLVAILAALVAHFVESQTGIVIVSTRTYFWMYLAIVASAGLLYHEQAKSARAAATAEPVAVAVGAAPTAGGTARSRRRRGSRPLSGGAYQAAARVWGGQAASAATAFSPNPILAYVILVLLGLMVLLGWGGIQDVEAPLTISFLGLLLGAGAIALSLGALPAVRFWRRQNWWIYGLGALATALVVVLNLNVVAADIFYKRGLGYDQSGQFEASVLEYNKAIRLAGNQDYYYLFLGRSFLELAKRNTRPKTVPAFEPTPEKLLNITPPELQRLGKEDLLNASRVALEEARNLNPLNTDHYANLGRLYRAWAESGDPTKLSQADAYFRQATTVSPRAAHLFVEWAGVDLAMGRADDAIAKTKTAAEIDPVFPPVFIAMGDAYQVAGRPKDALAAHGQALALSPTALSDAGFDQRLAGYEKAGLLGDFEALYAKAARDAPNVPAVHSAYGFILARNNKLREAMAAFETTVRLSPTDWLAHRNLALVYQGLGLLDQAIASAQTAQRYAPQEQAAALQGLVSELQKKR